MEPTDRKHATFLQLAGEAREAGSTPRHTTVVVMDSK